MLHLRGGLAGLMGLPSARANQFAGTNWLLFVERLPQHERVPEAELQAHPGSGRVRKLDLRSSLGTHSPAHLKDALSAHADRLRDWLGRGAQLSACGSRRGMGERVHACLLELLEESAVDALLAAGRYRRGVFWERGFGIGDSGFAGEPHRLRHCSAANRTHRAGLDSPLLRIPNPESPIPFTPLRGVNTYAPEGTLAPSR